MKKAEIKTGEKYLCKVGRNFTEVRIDAEHPNGGWVGTNTHTNRPVRIKSAQRLRYPSPLAKAAVRQNEDCATTKPAAPQVRKSKKTSLIDAAVQILRKAGTPMNAKEMVDAIMAKGIWSSNGKTPHATLYAAIIREIQKKGSEARFTKIKRGHFALGK